MCTVDEALSKGREILNKSGIESAALDARLLLSQVTGWSKVELLIKGDELLSKTDIASFSDLIKKRSSGYPIAYMLGYKEFWGLKLKVNADVLIPRPDTEILVERALAQEFKSVLDMGTGSGAIILAIKSSRKDCNACACDASEAALTVAKENAAALNLAVEFVKSSWFEAFGGRKFDLIVSNPPYIRADDEHLQQTSLPFEPLCALTSGNDGLQDLRLIIADAKSYLNDGGHILLEHGYDQGKQVRSLLAEVGFTDITTAKDLGGNERVSYGRKA